MFFNTSFRLSTIKIIGSLLFFQLLLLAVSLFHRPIYFDDAWFAEQAFQLSQFGHIRTEVFQGLPYYENQLLTAHKFLIINGAFFIKLFGFSPYTIKAVAVLYTLLLVYFFHRYIKDFQVFTHAATVLLFFLFYLMQNFVVEYFYAYRPEPIIAALGFASFYFLEKGLQQSAFRLMTLAGFLAGLCAFTHLNGVIFMGAGGLLLLISREYKQTMVFSVSSLVGLGLYFFFDIHSQQDLLAAFTQFRNDPALRDDNFTFWYYITKLADEHKRLFWDYAESTMTVCLLVALLGCFRYLRRHHAHLLYYTLFLMGLLAIISRNASSQYYLLYMPFTALVSVVALEHIYVQSGRVLRWLAFAAVLVYAGINVYLNIKMTFQKEYLLDTHRKIAALVPRQSRINASLYFVFNELDHYDMQTVEAYYLASRKNPEREKTFFDFCKKHRREYIVIEPRDEIKTRMPWADLQNGNADYQYFTSVDQYMILKATFIK